MKFNAKVKKLERRRADYDKCGVVKNAPSGAYRRPGSMK